MVVTIRANPTPKASLKASIERKSGARAGHLETGEVLQLTDYVEPLVLLSGNMAIVIEYCWGGGPTYAVFLD